MRPVKEAWEVFAEHSGKASTVARQLAFAGIAIVWIFKIGNTSIPDELRIPLVCFIVALALDLIQYCYLSVAWGINTWREERKFESDREIAEDKQIPIPTHLNTPGIGLWMLKIGVMFLGYVVLILNLKPLLFE